MSRLYSKQVGRLKIDDGVRRRPPERDAIIWEIDQDNDLVKLKIQGSNTLVRARYHQVITSLPTYLKVGAAASIRFRRANKGFVDVTGPGRAIPSPVAGGGALPPIALSDMILSGLVVTATDPTSMSVAVSSGTYRINNVLYNFSGTFNFLYTMASPPPLLMGTDNVTMGPSEFTVEIPAAPTTFGYGRYDILVIGTDAVIDVISGTAVNLSTTEPTLPTVPTNHLLVATIFIKYGDTSVTQAMIDQNYSPPVADNVSVVLSGSWVTTYQGQQALDWNPLGTPYPTCTITIKVYNQYGGLINYNGVRGRLTKVGGYGQMSGSYTGWRTDWVETNVTTQAVFQYQRDQSAPEISPVFTYEVSNFSYIITFILLGVSGLPVNGQ